MSSAFKQRPNSRKIQAEKAHDKSESFCRKKKNGRSDETAIMKLEQLAAQIQRKETPLYTPGERLERLRASWRRTNAPEKPF